jgi:hypothetical protein
MDSGTSVNQSGPAWRLAMADLFDAESLEPQAAGGDYEEITSEEVDRVIEALEKLMGQTTSENIRAYLEEAADNIFDLVYGEDADVVADAPEVLDEAA